MLAKLTRGNQLTIPKTIIDRAKLKSGRDYLMVAYHKGVIFLRPIHLTSQRSPQIYARLLRDAFGPAKRRPATRTAARRRSRPKRRR